MSMMLRLCILAVVSAFIASIGDSWQKSGIGRVVRVVPASTSSSRSFIVASEKGVIARLAIDDLSIVWRQAPLNVADIFESISVFDGASIPIVVAIVQTGATPSNTGKIVRVLNVTDGKLLWEISGCGVGKVPSVKALAIRSCGPDSALQLVNIVDGNGTEDSASLGDSVSWVDATAGAGEDSASEIVWRSGFKKESGDPVEVISSSNAVLVVRRPGSDKGVTRHEGAAHAIGSVFLTGKSEQGNEILSMVVLSEFGSLLSFDLETDGRDGQVRWAVELPSSVDNPQKRNCTLVSGHLSIAGTICVYESVGGIRNSIVTFTDGVRGEHLLIKNLESFDVAHAVFSNECCTSEDACLYLSDDSAKATMVSTCAIESQPSSDDHILISAPIGSDAIEGFRNGRRTWRQQLTTGLSITRVAFNRARHISSRQERITPFAVTGDRELLYKHTDPSSILVLARHSEHSNGAAMALIMDARSGSVLKAVNHANASAPFSATGCDNWFVYSFWNTFMLQQELHVIDLYKQRSESNFVVENLKSVLTDTYPPAMPILKRILERIAPTLFSSGSSNPGTCSLDSNGVQSCSSYAHDMEPGPQVLHTSFLLSHPVIELDHSETEGGITERSVIFALSNGQVVSLSRMAVDARRPPKGSRSQSESLVPYYPYISFLPSEASAEFVTRDSYLAGIKGVSVAPVKWKESACHVAVYGVDLYYRRLSPAGSFDTLPEDFGFSAVLGSVALVALAAMYSTRVVRSKKLREAWYKDG